MKQVALASLLVDAKPGFATADDLDEGVFQVRMNNITRDGAFDYAKRRRVSVDARKLDGLLLKAGDVLFNATNSPDLVGKSAFVADIDEPATYSNHFIRLRPRTDVIDGRYLARWLHTLFQAGKFKSLCKQWVNQATVSRESLLALEIPLPPLPEQRRIAAILDKADALRTKRREALAHLDRLAQSIFVEMFGDPESIYAKWPVKPLGELLEFLTSGSRGWAEYYADSGALFLRIQNVRNDRLDLGDVAFVQPPDSAEARRTRVQKGDVLLSITADLGRTAVVPEGLGRAHINQHLSILRTSAIVPRYLSAFLSSPAGQREVLGRNKQGVKAGLNFDDIRSFRIPIPPDELQNDFLALIEKAELFIEGNELSLKHLDALFASLQERAFRGEL